MAGAAGRRVAAERPGRRFLRNGGGSERPAAARCGLPRRTQHGDGAPQVAPDGRVRPPTQGEPSARHIVRGAAQHEPP